MNEVKIVKIDKVEKHPAADTLMLNHIGDTVVISNLDDDGSSRYNEGDLAVYIPEGAILPEWMLKKLGLWNEEKEWGVLAGKQGNRMKKIKLCGLESRGMLYPVEYDEQFSLFWIKSEVHSPEILEEKFKLGGLTVGQDVTEHLGIQFGPNIPDLVHKDGKKSTFSKFASINNLKNKMHDLRIKHGTDLPVVKATLTEKIHGSNAAVSYSERDGFQVQKRSTVITPQNDNAECAKYAYDNEDAWMKIINYIAFINNINLYENSLYVFFEWAGGNIQQKSCVSGIKEKMSFIFRNAKVVPHDEEQDHHWISTFDIDMPLNNIYNTTQFKTWEIEIDLNNPETIRDQMEELLNKFEHASPIGKHFGFEDNILEGFVVEFMLHDHLHRFKYKGDSHAKSYKKPIMDFTSHEEFDEINNLAKELIPAWRLDQGYDEVDHTEYKNVGLFIRWIQADVRKECVAETSELEPKKLKMLHSAIAKVAKTYWDGQLKG